MMASKHLTQYQNNHLKSDESIIANIKANAGKAMGKGHNKQINNGELILTTNELVFYKKGLTGETKNAIPLKNISSINTKSGMLTFDFVISSSGNDFHFNSTDKKGASSFESKLNSTLNGTSESSVKSAPKKKSGKFLKVGLAVFVVLMIIGSLIDEPETTTETANTSQESNSTSNDATFENLINSSAEPYSILRSEDLSHASRSRINANVLAPTAITPEQQKATAAKAAKELQLQNRVQVVSVNLFTEKDGVPVIQLNYSPDTKAWSDGEATGNRFNVE